MKNVVLITGASSGIGSSFARLYGKERDLYLLGRNTAALEKLKEEIEKESGHSVYIQSIDLTDADAPAKVYRTVQEEGLFVRTLINNAGFGTYGDFADGKVEDYKKMIDLNDRALVELTYFFLKDMQKEKRGEILNVASIASFFPGPGMAVYYASKAFVLSFSRALHEEVRKQRITVSCLCPGPVSTNFAKTAGADQAKFFSSGLVHGPDQVALYGKYLLDHKRSYGVEGLLNKAGVFFGGLLPSPLDARILGFIQSMKK
ncbi:MAG: SDR family oxidoreductase [Erysipelotrichaceae bacterium]|nr:SDR family oxidoreductase [Erysipelotrichaceae bacterium]MBQ1810623.1 SDR family oxidoreductase [Erysipelotrichaceae bacterium]MBQ5756208.1 SDR family oxidoreductase [Erysipelotrichaceae bacterium]